MKKWDRDRIMVNIIFVIFWSIFGVALSFAIANVHKKQLKEGRSSLYPDVRINEDGY